MCLSPVSSLSLLSDGWMNWWRNMKSRALSLPASLPSPLSFLFLESTNDNKEVLYLLLCEWSPLLTFSLSTSNNSSSRAVAQQQQSNNSNNNRSTSVSLISATELLVDHITWFISELLLFAAHYMMRCVIL